MHFLKNKTRREKLSICILSALLLFSILFLIISRNRQDGLAVYLKENEVSIWDNEDSATLDIEMSPYTSSLLNLGFSVPSDWIGTELENGVVYKHAESGSVFRMEISDYTPDINNITAEISSSSLVTQGYSFVNHIRLSPNSYQVLYQDKKTPQNDYVDTYYWDRGHVVKLSCIFSDANFEGIMPYFDKIMGSFRWNYEAPIPSGFGMYYNTGLGIETAVPENWTAQASDVEIRFVDEATSSTLIISAVSSDSYLDALTATDMSGMVKSGRPNFMLKDFTTSHDRAYALCTYTDNGKQVVCDQYIFADGARWYFISLNYYQGILDSSWGNAIAETFRSYNTAASGTE